MPKKRELTEEDQATRERLGVALRQASSARSFGPQDMAAAGGVSLAHQYRVEGGETTPDALYLFKVCRFLGITMDSLFNGAAAVDQAPPATIVQTSQGDNAIQVAKTTGKVSIKRR